MAADGAYGYSRDHREDRPQILLAVATDTEGIPIHLEVLHGLLASLKRRFGIRQAVFVFDNGMSSTLNLEAMRKEDLHFVTRLSTATLREVVAQLLQENQPQLWDGTKLIELTLEGKRYVIAGGVYRQQRDFARRNARLEKAQNELKRLAAVRRRKPDAQKLASQAGRALQRLKAHKYFRYWVDEKGQLEYKKNDRLIEIEQSLDGLVRPRHSERARIGARPRATARRSWPGNSAARDGTRCTDASCLPRPLCRCDQGLPRSPGLLRHAVWRRWSPSSIVWRPRPKMKRSKCSRCCCALTVSSVLLRPGQYPPGESGS